MTELQHAEDEPLCPHPNMWEAENTSAPDRQRCLLCGRPRAEIEAERRADRCTCGMDQAEREGHGPQHADWCEVSDG